VADTVKDACAAEKQGANSPQDCGIEYLFSADPVEMPANPFHRGHPHAGPSGQFAGIPVAMALEVPRRLLAAVNFPAKLITSIQLPPLFLSKITIRRIPRRGDMTASFILE
jgi:hypothetical protein